MVSRETNIWERKQNKNIYVNSTPDNDRCPRNKRGKIKSRQMLEANEMKLLWKTVGKTKIDKIRSQQMREFCGNQDINEWIDMRRIEWK